MVILNFTPIPRHGYRVGVPRSGTYREILNTDSRYYGGSDVGNPNPIQAEEVSWMGRPFSISLSLPPLGAVVIKQI